MPPRKSVNQQGIQDTKRAGLIRQRAALKSKLTRFSSFFVDVEDDPSETKLYELAIRLEKAEAELLPEFSRNEQEIESIDLDDYRCDELEVFESKCYQILAKVKAFLASFSPGASTPGAMGQGAAASPSLPGRQSRNLGIKYPIIELPKFSGIYEKWLEFKELYLSLIHNSTDLDPIQKFHYLRASLEGSAAHCIQSIDLSNDNYFIAWDILCNRFDNKQLMIHKHIKNLFNIYDVKPDSAFSFRNLVDTISKTLRALENLKIDISSWDPLIIYLVTTKLDSTTLQDWEKQEPMGELPTLSELKTFLSNRADFLDKLNMHKGKFSKPKDFNRHSTKVLASKINNSVPSPSKYSCYFCKEPHSIFKCEAFLALPVSKRHERILALKLCTNCLQKNHQVDTCKSGNCKFCSEKHNSILHPNNHNLVVVPNEPQGSSKDSHYSQLGEASFTTGCSFSLTAQTLLATVQVAVIDSLGKKHMCRALLDNGSMSNFICERFFKKLALPQNKIKLSIAGIGRSQSNISSSCNIKLQSLHSDFNTQLHCLVISNITDDLPNSAFNPISLDIPSNIALSDPSFSKPGQIDLLIGADTFWSLILSEKIDLGKNKPVLQNTKLGWILSGPIGAMPHKFIKCHFSKNVDLQSQLAKFWELDQLSDTPLLSPEEITAEEHFEQTFKRNTDGRFVVHIPLKNPVTLLGESKQTATRQFFSLEKRFSSNPELRNMYVQFMHEYNALKHMSPFYPANNQTTYFSPHHGVSREESCTTRLRVVFNSSSPSSTGISYNSLQMVGPTVQEDLLSILLRFRQHTYVVTADICKMYRQILIAEEFKALQLILWRASPEDHLQTYSLDTLMYGTASAPFLATRCLKQLAIEHAHSHPKAADAIKADFYVDDFLSGAESINELTDLCSEVNSILASAGFLLRKWKTNNQDVFTVLEGSSPSTDTFYFSPLETCKTLGMLWSSQSDILSFKINLPSHSQTITKRIILSETAKIFDPLGLLSPVVIQAKIFLQHLWTLKVGWDGEVPQELSKMWTSFRSDLLDLNSLEIPRHSSCKKLIHVELHGFSDASQKAYGACIYLRTTDISNTIHVNLLVSKTRVAPLKTVSIPRLELCAAKLLSELFQKVIKSLTLKINGHFLWSDSTVTLAWIRTPPHMLQIFVGNRVKEIQANTNICYWNYVPTTSNPADLLSRGLSPRNLLNSSLWFNGPPWLKLHPEMWPKDLSAPDQLQLQELPEVRNQSFSFVQVKPNTLFPFDKFSSFGKLKRVFAYCLRFINNCRHITITNRSSPSIDELRNSEQILCQMAQREMFSEELHDLSTHKEVKSSSKILSLTPFIEDNLIRVGGRLKHSSYSYNKRHPIILSSKHHLTLLIFRHEHFKLMHCGPQMLLSSIRETFWPVAGRNLAKRVVRNCMVCFRFKPVAPSPIMGNLPGPRVSQNLPFTHTGVDYAGPFYIKDRKGRGAKTHKCYIALFICLTVKAVHLETVSELSTIAFLETLQRFIARRGIPSTMYSDNGKNFVGANNKLQELGEFLRSNKDSLTQSIITKHDIKWSFIPAYSPHQGGLWEAGVKSSKFHLLRTLKNSILTFESFSTIVTQIEGVLNSRPLTQLSTDPNDLEALTPAHFLIGRSLLTIPYYDVQHVAENRLSNYEMLEALKQRFWCQWTKDYISQLQARSKWKTNRNEIAVGSLVLVRDDNIPPYLWRLGRIVLLHPGTDNVTRVVTIKTAGGLIKRSTVKICPLPIEIDT